MTFRRIKRGRYWSYELDGKRPRSFTTIIREGVPKPNLIDWAARMSAEYAADNLDDLLRLDRDAAVDTIKTAHRRNTNAAMAKGTEIHGIAEKLATGIDVEVPEPIAGYVDGYLRFVDEWKPQPHAIEVAVANRKWQYAGTADAVAHLDDMLVLLDIKTGGSGVWPETCLQVAAYRFAEVMLDRDGREVPMPQTDGGFALWLSDAGTYELLPLECGPDVFSAFVHASRVAEFMGRDKDDLIGLPRDPVGRPQ